jgi:uncharacterized membrane protein
VYPAAVQGPESTRSFARFDPRRAAGRMVLAAIASVVAAFSLPKSASEALHVVVAWDAGSLSYLALAWSILWTATPQQTKRRAGAEDPGRTFAWILVLLASTFSLFTCSVVLRRAKTIASPGEAGALVAACLFAVMSAWALTHTAYALRYAHLYYRDDHEGVGGLEFPGHVPPDAFDFAYYSFTIGMCFQVSDVCITSRQIRRATLGHAVLSFLYNTAVLALALNLVFGMVG